METSSQNEKNSALFRKYLAGKCSAEEKQVLEEWYNSFDLSPLPEAGQEKASLKRVRKWLLANVGSNLPRPNPLLRLSLSFRIAAVIALVCSISLLIYFAGNFDAEPQLEFHALNGQLKVISLPDGSIVTLNAGSTLKVGPDFRKTNRSVELSGEAYFEVSKDASRPFIVSTGVLSTRVLGTAFNVQAYPNDRLLAVTVAEGKVRVDSERKRLSSALTPGRQLIYNKSDKTSEVVEVNTAHISAWRGGILYFDNESIPDIAKRLERKFNVKIEVRGEARPDCRYTLRISKETLGKTLRLLSTVAGIKYITNSQNQITINTALCK
ncbi:FecR family protein [Pedobacter sp. MC2016-24]|uniref:FecR family protein n=1 Tax=Pedobacter sp. MC2016-24 TaxID=2780090 RepID=UPI001881ADE8|nr:FecR family protein [Pedobacter sp. MC2016-24]MBE9601589.1 FecR domain-containing protein [Pedobacter sp. MC2016-24]